jgi:hypothetical protein
MFQVHQNTENIILIWTSNRAPYLQYKDEKMLSLFDNFITKVKEKLNKFFAYKNPVITKLVFAKLYSKSLIYKHTYQGKMLRIVQRIHIPVFTNSNVTVMINNEKFFMELVNIYNFNNTMIHAVNNNSNENRIHLIIDYIDQSMLDKFKVDIKPSNQLVF